MIDRIKHYWHKLLILLGIRGKLPEGYIVDPTLTDSEVWYITASDIDKGDAVVLNPDGTVQRCDVPRET